MKRSIKQVYFQSDDFVKISQLEKDHFTGQEVACKDCEPIYLMCLFFFFFLQALSVSIMSVLPQNTRERAK